MEVYFHDQNIAFQMFSKMKLHPDNYKGLFLFNNKCKPNNNLEISINPDVTEKASEGHYVAYLFPSNSNTLILGLCQSHDEAKQQYGKEFDVALTKQAELMRMKIPEFSEVKY